MLWNVLRFGLRYRDRGCVDRPGTRLDEQIAPAGVPPIVAILENTTFFLPEPFAEQFVDLLQDRALRRAVHLFDGIREQVEVVSQRGHVGFRLRPRMRPTIIDLVGRVARIHFTGHRAACQVLAQAIGDELRQGIELMSEASLDSSEETTSEL